MEHQHEMSQETIKQNAYIFSVLTRDERWATSNASNQHRPTYKVNINISFFQEYHRASSNVLILTV